MNDHRWSASSRGRPKAECAAGEVSPMAGPEGDILHQEEQPSLGSRSNKRGFSCIV